MSRGDDNKNSKAELIKPRTTFADLFYPEHIEREVKALLEDEKFADALIDEGLHPKRKILLHGPSGCGKTSVAHAIASELKLDLLEAPGNVIMNCYVGETEKNIANTIRQARQQKCVLLMDEFEAIAGQRDGESRFITSMVDTLLVQLEDNSMEGFFIACTNHIKHIDDALLRRFDLVLEIPMPCKAALRKVADNITKGRYGIKAEDCMINANTPALVERNAKDLLRKAVIAAEKINPRPKKPKPQPQKEPEIFIKPTGGSDDNKAAEKVYIPPSNYTLPPWMEVAFDEARAKRRADHSRNPTK